MLKRKVLLTGLVSLIILAVSFGLLAIPQFMQFNGKLQYSASGYEFFFNCASDLYNGATRPTSVSGLGIACIVVMGLAVVSSVVAVLFSKEGSAFILFGGLLNVAAAIMFFCMSLSRDKVYDKFRSLVDVGWVTYVIGGLLMLAGLLCLYVSVRLILQEKKAIATKQSYSYLKK